MNNYYVRRTGSDELAHGFGHKYIKKIATAGGKFKYIYDTKVAGKSSGNIDRADLKKRIENDSRRSEALSRSKESYRIKLNRADRLANSMAKKEDMHYNRSKDYESIANQTHNDKVAKRNYEKTANERIKAQGFREAKDHNRQAAAEQKTGYSRNNTNESKTATKRNEDIRNYVEAEKKAARTKQDVKNASVAGKIDNAKNKVVKNTKKAASGAGDKILAGKSKLEKMMSERDKKKTHVSYDDNDEYDLKELDRDVKRQRKKRGK